MNFKENVYKELEEIVNHLQIWENVSKSKNVYSVSLLSGLSSILIVLLDTLLVFPSLVKTENIKSYIDKLVEILNEEENLIPSYCGGIAGFGILLQNLIDKNLFVEDYYTEFLEEIDEVLIDMLKIEIQEDNLDILHGAMGIGLYFIKRGKHNQAIGLIDLLESNSVKKNNEIFWKTFDKYKSKKYSYDFGLAHGNASILYFLLKCLKNNIHFEKTKLIIDGLIKFYLNQEQIIGNDIYSFYPYSINADDFENLTFNPKNTRLAWCYGDLGIFHTLLLAAKLLEYNDLEKKVIEKIIHVSKRMNIDEIHNHDMDAGFCHGTSGVGLLFKNIYDITGEEKILPTIDYWYKLTLNTKDKNSFNGFNILGYNFPIFDNSLQNLTLLEGLAGVAASNLKYLSKNISLTEEALFLKI